MIIDFFISTLRCGAVINAKIKNQYSEGSNTVTSTYFVQLSFFIIYFLRESQIYQQTISP